MTLLTFSLISFIIILLILLLAGYFSIKTIIEELIKEENQNR